jgi:hypothetical protein
VSHSLRKVSELSGGCQRCGEDPDRTEQQEGQPKERPPPVAAYHAIAPKMTQIAKMINRYSALGRHEAQDVVVRATHTAINSTAAVAGAAFGRPPGSPGRPSIEIKDTPTGFVVDIIA